MATQERDSVAVTNSSELRKNDKRQQLLRELLAPAGVEVFDRRDFAELPPHNPYDVIINHPKTYDRVFGESMLGAGEAYMDGDWDCDQLDELMTRVFRSNLEDHIKGNKALAARLVGQNVANRLKFFADRDSQAQKLADEHYNLGNEFYKRFLDTRLLYTCGYWKNAESLDEAQEAKLELVCQKIGIEPGMRALDVGGGWGGFATYAAEKHGVHVVNITIAEEQIKEAETRRLALPKEAAARIENRFQDYRDVTDGPYDRIVSMGMFEHIGHQNYHTYMEVMHRNLADDGLFLLHCIGSDSSRQASASWITKYIFPYSEIPRSADVAKAYQDLFVMEDWHNFGADYDATLMEWFKNFDANWEQSKDQFGDNADTFYRMWKLYLLGSVGAFRSRGLQLWQMVFSKTGVPGGYQSVR